MALVVQTDDGAAAGANAYISVADFKTYHGDRGNDISAFSDPQISAGIIRGTDFVDQRFEYKGEKLLDAQTTMFPRQIGVQRVASITTLDTAGTTFGWWIIDPTGNEIIGIPEAIKKATAEYALRALTAPLFQDAPAPEGGQIIRRISQEVDVIKQSIEFEPAQSGSFAMPAFPAADFLLLRAGLIEPGRRLMR